MTRHAEVFVSSKETIITVDEIDATDQVRPQLSVVRL